MKLSQNWVAASINNQLIHYKQDLDRYKEEGNDKMVVYYKGIILGLEAALAGVKEVYSKAEGK